MPFKVAQNIAPPDRKSPAIPAKGQRGIYAGQAGINRALLHAMDGPGRGKVKVHSPGHPQVARLAPTPPYAEALAQLSTLIQHEPLLRGVDLERQALGNDLMHWLDHPSAERAEEILSNLDRAGSGAISDKVVAIMMSAQQKMVVGLVGRDDLLRFARNEPPEVFNVVADQRGEDLAKAAFHHGDSDVLNRIFTYRARADAAAYGQQVHEALSSAATSPFHGKAFQTSVKALCAQLKAMPRLANKLPPVPSSDFTPGKFDRFVDVVARSDLTPKAKKTLIDTSLDRTAIKRSPRSDAARESAVRILAGIGGALRGSSPLGPNAERAADLARHMLGKKLNVEQLARIVIESPASTPQEQKMASAVLERARDFGLARAAPAPAAGPVNHRAVWASYAEYDHLLK